MYAGTPQAKPGDLVRAGQVLIRGEEKGAGGETRPVRARGEVMARVWISAAVRLPIKEYQSCPTGNQTERRLILTPFFSWALADEPAYLTADKRVATVPLGGAWLPVQLQREAFQEVYLEERERNLEDVKREGAKAALQRLDQLVIGEETVDKWLKFAMIERDTIEVEATAEVTRQIGRFCAP